ncbi:zinc finger MYM-type protein 1-like, partial [Sipha flava]|uniref:Zinc finger MYM-type protein 1-like n=1 Tax=Sipha flava TaxID=143950 RepID=A0A8B8F5R3_9HEMI
IWVPDDCYIFPGSGKRNLKFQRCWFKRWNWLAYSEKDDGAYCKYCVLFAGEGGGVGKQTFGNLVKKPFKNWKDGIEVFNNNTNCEYHKTCILKGTCAKQILKKKVEPIDIQIDSGIKRKIIENRKNLIPIIETIIFCGRQNLSLRGHRDSGPLNLTEPNENDGNFRSLLRFRANSGDVSLKTHLETCSKNASYTSPMIANEIISTCGDIILKKIVNKINEAKCFSILADETSDISGIEQFSLCARYFYTAQPICARTHLS